MTDPVEISAASIKALEKAIQEGFKAAHAASKSGEIKGVEDALETATKLMGQTKEASAAAAAQVTHHTEKLQQYVDVNRDLAEVLQQEAKVEAALSTQRAKQIVQEEAIIKYKEKLLEKDKIKQKLSKEALAKIKEELKDAKDRKKALEEEQRAAENLEDSLQKLREAKLALNDTGKKFAETIVGTNGHLKALAKNMAEVEDPVSFIIGGFKSVTSAGDLWMSAGTKLLEITLAYTKAMISFNKEIEASAAAFAKATGAGRQYDASIIEGTRDLLDYGATSEEVSRSLQSLYTDFCAFTTLNQQEQNTLRDTTVFMG